MAGPKWGSGGRRFESSRPDHRSAADSWRDLHMRDAAAEQRSTMLLGGTRPIIRPPGICAYLAPGDLLSSEVLPVLMLSSAFDVQRPIAAALALAAGDSTTMADAPALSPDASSLPAAAPASAVARVSTAGEDTMFRSGFRWSVARRAMTDLFFPDVLVAPPVVSNPTVGDPVALVAWRLVSGWIPRSLGR